MIQRSALEASGAALAMLIAWWGGVSYLDGVLAETFPYHRYETISLLYPDIFYPALPGWILAHAQPFSLGFWLVAFGWMIALPAAIGIGAAKYSSERDRSSTATAIGFVLVLFLVVTVVEAFATLLG